MLIPDPKGSHGPRGNIFYLSYERLFITRFLLPRFSFADPNSPGPNCGVRDEGRRGPRGARTPPPKTYRIEPSGASSRVPGGCSDRAPRSGPLKPPPGRAREPPTWPRGRRSPLKLLPNEETAIRCGFRRQRSKTKQATAANAGENVDLGPILHEADLIELKGLT